MDGLNVWGELAVVGISLTIGSYVGLLAVLSRKASAVRALAFGVFAILIVATANSLGTPARLADNDQNPRRNFAVPDFKPLIREAARELETWPNNRRLVDWGATGI